MGNQEADRPFGQAQIRTGKAVGRRGASTDSQDAPSPDYDGPVCARSGCGRPLVRRVLPSGKLESAADFRRRTCCSPECRREVQRAGLGLPSRRSRSLKLGTCRRGEVRPSADHVIRLRLRASSSRATASPLSGPKRGPAALRSMPPYRGLSHLAVARCGQRRSAVRSGKKAEALRGGMAESACCGGVVVVQTKCGDYSNRRGVYLYTHRM